MFSTKEYNPSSGWVMGNCKLRGNLGMWDFSNKYLVAILESTGYHGIGRSNEDEKISRLAIFEHYTIYPNLKINRILPNDTDSFLEELSLFGEIKTINKDHAVDLSNSTKRPGVLIYTVSSNNPGEVG